MSTATKIVGITSAASTVPMNFSSGLDVISIPRVYADIVLENGAVPLIIPALPFGNAASEAARDIVRRVDALILISGHDISPSSYRDRCRIDYTAAASWPGEPYKRPLFLKPDEARDRAEIALYRAAREQGKAVLGVCRGMQLMNVADGGTLLQEVDESVIKHSIGADGWVHYHEIEIDQATRLGSIFNKSTGIVSSVHHQAIHRLAKNFLVVAKAADGVIEMIEDPSSPKPVWGIQGHPEKITENFPEYKRMFEGFIRSI